MVICLQSPKTFENLILLRKSTSELVSEERISYINLHTVFKIDIAYSQFWYNEKTQ